VPRAGDFVSKTSKDLRKAISSSHQTVELSCTPGFQERAGALTLTNHVFGE
jgi:hypothetical protein